MTVLCTVKSTAALSRGIMRRPIIIISAKSSVNQSNKFIASGKRTFQRNNRKSTTRIKESMKKLKAYMKPDPIRV